MNKPLSEKEKLLTMLADVYDQLEELESVLEASFSDLRIRLNNEEHGKLTEPVQSLSALEKKFVHTTQYGEIPDSSINQVPKSLKLELGYSLPLK
ncbi:hypothetical protein FAY30_15790 [Bacillus sp. S3]|uniref:hypothetical protein n=1 Tax=Bacillus sp. S3 TaxID=486398 RepID=UPI001189B798|nr:hypothetical protein [Bacillus sp. S3]QCJ43243.1 hypothetical protein FAY30_15790 [Bacillus sp. S3]